ncbi:MAG TPA: adenosylmethionine decarboxylase [Halomicronema sp.]
MGTHLVVDAWQSPGDLLNDPERIRRALIDAISAGGATLIDLCVHQFSPHGVTATATLAESHIAIHTWPEYGYFAADLFFCGAGEPKLAMQVLKTALQAGKVTMRETPRGFDPEMGADEPVGTDFYMARPKEAVVV